MPLSPGEKLGPYQIVSAIGAGGMGEVYKALDTRLDRTVAVKVLPDHIANRDDLHARFEREARAVASLNHPHICTLHDIGRIAETSFLVMELIEGETLASRIEKGPIPLEQALKYAAQIADAIDRAHRAGVTHRDIKPQNIMLTRDGVKVLDFGLSKSNAAPGPSEATLTRALTTEGTVMGTPQYMAPEQFEGREADARADIWAFGAVLYEMVTGQKAFQGKNYASLLGAILSADPAPMAVTPFTPAWLERLVRRCLNKDPELRYHCMRDVALDLLSPPPAAKPERTSRPWAWMALAGIAALAASAGWGLYLRNTAPTPRLVRFHLQPPQGARFANVGAEISPDGRIVAFLATSDKTRIYLQSLDSFDPRPLSGTEGASAIFWSPDSKSLAFIGGAKLQRLDLAGGTAVTLCEISGPAIKGTWGDNGVIIFGGPGSGLHQVPASGGTPRKLVLEDQIQNGVSVVFAPRFLPGGREFLFSVVNLDPAKTGIYLGYLDGKPPVRIREGGGNTTTRYDASSRRLLFLGNDRSLMAQPLSLDPPALTGDPVAIASDLSLGMFGAGFSLSGNGTLCYRRAAEANRRLLWRGRAGNLIESVAPAKSGYTFSLSPDGTHVALNSSSRQSIDVWVLDLVHDGSSPLILSNAADPLWSSNGNELYYRNGNGFHRKSADGSGVEVTVWKGDTRSPQSLSPDGKHLLFGVGDVMSLSLDGQSKPEPYVQTSAFEGSSTFSPDGRWVAYDSSESGGFQVFVQGFPERRGKWLVSPGGGYRPQWRADGKELFWVNGGRLMAATIELQPGSIRVGRPETLFPLPGGWVQPSADGRKFLVAESEGTPSEFPLEVVENWAVALGK